MSAEALFANLNREFYGALSADGRSVIDGILRELKGALYMQQTIALCMMSIQIYDFLACFVAERRLIWKRKWSLTTGLYVWTRYLYVAETAYLLALFFVKWTDATCSKIVNLVGFIPVFVTLPTHMIMLLRAWAVWNRAAWVVWTSVPVMLLEAALMAWAAFSTRQKAPIYGGVSTACFPVGDNACALSYVAGIIFLDIWFTALVMIKTFTIKKEQRGVGVVHLGHLVNLLWQDSMRYLLMISTINFFNLVWFAVRLHHTNFSAISPVATTSQVLLTLHMVLALREEADDTTRLRKADIDLPTISSH